MPDIDEIRGLHDRAYEKNQQTREDAANDMVFAWITQWDDSLLGESQLEYRGEFNIIRKGLRHVLSLLANRDVAVDFEPIETSAQSDTLSDLMDGMYRTTIRKLESREAFRMGRQETVTCGFGAWELENKYTGVGNLQEISRCPIHEANNTLFFDPNAQLEDKSDAKYASILKSFSREGIEEYVYELTGEEGYVPSNFKTPEESYVFPWILENERYFIGRFFMREAEQRPVHMFVDLMGNPIEIRDDDLPRREEMLMQAGYEFHSTVFKDVHCVRRYIVTGQDILEEVRVPGEHIPIVPMYGERQFVEGEEHYEGIVRLAKDPQRLRNFQLSYLASLVGQSPRRKPIFTADQIEGFEEMYELNGSDNNFPYLLQHRLTAMGEELPLGPVGEMPEQPIPTALGASIELSRQAVEDVINPGLPQNLSDVDMSGRGVEEVNRRMDQQSALFQESYKTALRRDAVVFASMATEIYDTSRNVTLTAPDGKRRQAQLMVPAFNTGSGQIEMMNDLTNAKFEIYADLRDTHETVEEEVRTDTLDLIKMLPPEDPIRAILILKYIERVPGSSFEDIRQFATQQLVRQGIRPPETPEEQQIAQAAQQQAQEPDANTLLAMAEMEKARADQAAAAVKQFEAETKRIDVGLKAQKQGYDIEKIIAETQGLRVKTVDDLSRSLMPDDLLADMAARNNGGTGRRSNAAGVPDIPRNRAGR